MSLKYFFNKSLFFIRSQHSTGIFRIIASPLEGADISIIISVVFTSPLRDVIILCLSTRAIKLTVQLIILDNKHLFLVVKANAQELGLNIGVWCVFNTGSCEVTGIW